LCGPLKQAQFFILDLILGHVKVEKKKGASNSRFRPVTKNLFDFGIYIFLNIFLIPIFFLSHLLLFLIFLY